VGAEQITRTSHLIIFMAAILAPSFQQLARENRGFASLQPPYIDEPIAAKGASDMRSYVLRNNLSAFYE
jgi:hypothetical protein